MKETRVEAGQTYEYVDTIDTHTVVRTFRVIGAATNTPPFFGRAVYIAYRRAGGRYPGIADVRLKLSEFAGSKFRLLEGIGNE